MRGDEPRLPDFLGHVLEAITRIERYTQGMDETGFAGNPLVQDAVIRNFEVLGEASRNIDRNDQAFSKAHPELSLGQAYRLRNAVIHGYFLVDLAILWKTIQIDLPTMKGHVEAAIADLDAPEATGPDRIAPKV